MNAPDQRDVYLAKWLYQSFAMLTLQTLGPAYRIPPSAGKVADVLRPALDAVVAQDTQVVPGQIFEVPSPWHAALYLGSLQHHLSLEGHRALFRGQSNSEWKITPSIGRAGTNRDQEERKAQLFCDLLSSLSFNTLTSYHPSPKFRLDLRISPTCYRAAAQHYGIKTDLIDFTTDAAIGVFFACSGKAHTDGQTSSVFVLPLANALERGLEIILPPPFVERLYTQRGIFVRSERVMERADFSMLEVRFPSAFSFSPFEVIRSNVGLVDVLPETKEIRDVLVAIDKELLIAPSHETSPKITEVASHLKQSFSSVYSDLLGMWGKYVEFFEEQLYWLAYQVDEETEMLSSESLVPIAASNPDLVAAVAQMYRWAVKIPSDYSGYTDEKKKHMLELASFLEEALGAG